MNKTFYLQTELKKITSDFIFSAFEGILKNNYQYKFFEDIDDVPLNKNVVVIGYVEDTIKWFEKMNIDEPKPFDVPDFLLPFAKREIDFKTRKSFIDGNIIYQFLLNHIQDLRHSAQELQHQNLQLILN